MIDWSEPQSQVSEHFTVKDALWLGKLERLATEADGLSDELIAELIDTIHMAEDIRAILGCPMVVSSMYRPPFYSPTVGGTSTDVHTQALAIDFICEFLSTDEIKAKLMPHLELMNIRMEDNGPGSGWIHLDRHAVIHARFFKP